MLAMCFVNEFKLNRTRLSFDVLIPSVRSDISNTFKWRFVFIRDLVPY